MKKRIKLKDRILPDYTHGEEVMNTVSHIAGGGFAIAIFLWGMLLGAKRGDAWYIASMTVYGLSLVCLYAMSSVYHGLRPGTGKKVLQILDHCTIYVLIAGTYTPIMLVGLRTAAPVLAWGMLAFQWGLCILAATLTAIDLKKYNVFSMVCYILMGWAVLPFAGQVIASMGQEAFLFLLLGGISYTLGAILYGLGSKVRWMHAVFHIFVVLGTVLQGICILFYL